MNGNHLPAPFLIPAADLAAHSPISVTILPDVPALDAHFADAVAAEVADNNQNGIPTRLILPVGPVGYLPRLAQLSNERAIAWQNVHLFLMDEYCDWQGRLVDPTHPLSFVGFAQWAFLARLRPELALPPAQLHIPDPRNLDAVSAEIARLGGIDSCYGGIGIHGHIAFNEPPISRWFTVTPAEFKASQTRLVQLAPETMVMNASRGASGNFAALPPMAVTLGMADLLGARRIRLYCQGGVWQRTVLRLALFGSPDHANGEDVNYPVTLLRDHNDLAIVTTVETALPPLPKMAA
ncbi:MAG: 6-phosphogluconolactonase [Caldilineaceae bacterium]|nr:6-phosphogluconolactonase [Caldilineaceae bacterium]